MPNFLRWLKDQIELLTAVQGFKAVVAFDLKTVIRDKILSKIWIENRVHRK
jgi:hypothetical protein